MKITLGDRTTMTYFEDIKLVAHNHFVELYTQREEENHSNIYSMLEHIPFLVTREENLDLT
jgi:hypothetical protein